MSSEDAWHFTLMKLDTWKQHKVAFSIQVQAMMTENQHLTLTPKSLFFLGLDDESYHDHPFIIILKPCPFCQKKFEPPLDVKFTSCKHFYHSWCALNHFSTSTKCCSKGVGKKCIQINGCFSETTCW